MARSSHGPRPATTWAVAQNPKPMPRVVRLGRPANDNFRRPNVAALTLTFALALALALLAAANWDLI